jgi:hypothetical protein
MGISYHPIAMRKACERAPQATKGSKSHLGSRSLFQDVSTGQIAISEMDGHSQIGGGPVDLSPGLSWTAVGTGDFNNDGHSDILWQNANGQASIWEMDGANRIGGGPVSPNPGPSWRAA